MIPLILPSLHALGVLVTRPEEQAAGLCQLLSQHGAHTHAWPTLRIEPLTFDVTRIDHCDLLIFISTHAVHHGQVLLQRFPQARLAAVGKATAQSLIDAGHTLDAVPERDFNSEALLQHPLLVTPPSHVTLVRGRGGRELLHDSLTTRGAQVSLAEVYVRTPITPDAVAQQALIDALTSEILQVITVTSVDVLHALLTTLPAALCEQLKSLDLLCGSLRIANTARELGWYGELIVAANPSDEAMFDALQRWHGRQR